ncbi:hypothetical protein GCM10023153_09620 [Ornithinibacter aureus]|uniref:Uncharacterized protein n=1 Tax=Ornithinibacter aureus TaxID=622664 RepID=A0ABP8JIS2_9MICO
MQQDLVDIGSHRVGHQVARVFASNQLGPELTPEACDDSVHGGDVEAGCLLGPDELEKDISRDGAPSPEQEGREEGAGSAAGGQLRTVGGLDTEWPQEAGAHSSIEPRRARFGSASFSGSAMSNRSSSRCAA